jgi:hypothetical protein
MGMQTKNNYSNCQSINLSISLFHCYPTNEPAVLSSLLTVADVKEANKVTIKDI